MTQLFQLLQLVRGRRTGPRAVRPGELVLPVIVFFMISEIPLAEWMLWISFDEANIPSCTRRDIGSETGSDSSWRSGLLLKGSAIGGNVSDLTLLIHCFWLQSFGSFLGCNLIHFTENSQTFLSSCDICSKLRVSKYCIWFEWCP